MKRLALLLTLLLTGCGDCHEHQYRWAGPEGFDYRQDVQTAYHRADSRSGYESKFEGFFDAEMRRLNYTKVQLCCVGPEDPAVVYVIHATVDVDSPGGE